MQRDEYGEIRFVGFCLDMMEAVFKIGMLAALVAMLGVAIGMLIWCNAA